MIDTTATHAMKVPMDIKELGRRFVSRAFSDQSLLFFK